VQATPSPLIRSAFPFANRPNSVTQELSRRVQVPAKGSGRGVATQTPPMQVAP